MALAETTLSSAVAAGDKQLVVASATGLAAGVRVKINGEIMSVTKAYVAASTTVPVRRGLGGSVQTAHPASARVVHGVPSDWSSPAGPGTPAAPGFVAKRVLSYSAAGAITLPNEGETMVAVLNATSVLAMTVADPGKDLDGCELIVIADGTAAHTLTFASGIGGESTSYDVITFNSGGPCAIRFIACNEFWLCPFAPAMTGTVTNLVGGIA